MKNMTKKTAASFVAGGVMAGTLAWADTAIPDLKGFRVAVVATDGFEQPELTEPVKALKQANATVDIISLKSGSIQGLQHMDKGDTVHVDKVLGQVSADDYDGLLLPGGAMNADTLRSVTEAQTFVLAFDRAHKPIGAICHAPWLLISTGIMRGRKLTSYHTIRDDITNAGGSWEDKGMVRDRNWVTSRQPSDLPAFNRGILELFSEAKMARTATDVKS